MRGTTLPHHAIVQGSPGQDRHELSRLHRWKHSGGPYSCSGEAHERPRPGAAWEPTRAATGPDAISPLRGEAAAGSEDPRMSEVGYSDAASSGRLASFDRRIMSSPNAVQQVLVGDL